MSSTCGFDLHVCYLTFAATLCCPPCSCSVNSGVQLLLGVYGDYLQQSGRVGTYHDHLAHLHGLVVNRGRSPAASAENLVSQLVLDRILDLSRPGDSGQVHVQQDDAQRVLWLMLDKLADEV